LHNLVVYCAISTWDDSDNDLVENDELCVMRYYDISFSSDRIKNAMIWMMRPKLKLFLSNLKNLIHDSFFQREIIERPENKILEF
jgi:hypothetical protein